MSRRRVLIVPAAGRGSRLDAARPKALVEVAGRPMLDDLLDLYQPLMAHVVVVASPLFRAELAAWSARHEHVSMVEQPAPTGMLDAVLVAAPVVHEQRAESVWITWADQVGVLPQTLHRLAALTEQEPPPALALPTVRRAGPYIHLERDASGRISGVRQRREGDEMPAEGESDMGLFAMTRVAFDRDLPDYASAVSPGTGTAERNFVPFVPWLARRSRVATFPCTDPREAVGINTPNDLREVETWLRAR